MLIPCFFVRISTECFKKQHYNNILLKQHYKNDFTQTTLQKVVTDYIQQTTYNIICQSI